AALATLILAGESGERVAKAASNRGFPGDGIVQRSYSSSDSGWGIALPNPYRNCSRVNDTARFLFAGFRSATDATRRADGGSVSTPLIGAGSIATAAATRFCPSNLWTTRPPNEWPMAIGFC